MTTLQRWSAWFEARPRVRRALLILGVLIAVVHFVHAEKRNWRTLGDLGPNREFGRRFLAGEDLYYQGCCYNYLPTAAMYWAPLAMVPTSVALAGRYFVALASLALVFWCLGSLAKEQIPARWWKPAFLMGVTLFLALHYVLRDLDDGGPNLILLAMLVGGLYLAARARWCAAGCSLALVTAVKLTPGLLVPYLAYRRQWRLLGWTCAWLAAWLVAPALWMGPSAWWQAQSQWNGVVLGAAMGAENEVHSSNEQRVQNQNLILALKRYVQTYPAGHPLRLGHAGYVDFLALEGKAAGAVVGLAVLGLLGWCSWRGRAPLSAQPPVAWLVEGSVVLLWSVLLSPVTWLQHLVLAIPAIYLLAAAELSGQRLGKAAWGIIAAYAVCVTLLNREFLGRENYLLLLSYHMHTWCTLALLCLVVQKRPLLSANAMREASRNESPVGSVGARLPARAA
jgi:alpha-1,2-mannosyltransferase